MLVPTKMLAAQTLKMWLPFLRRRKTKGSKYQTKTKKKLFADIVHLLLLFQKQFLLAIPTEFGVSF